MNRRSFLRQLTAGAAILSAPAIVTSAGRFVGGFATTADRVWMYGGQLIIAPCGTIDIDSFGHAFVSRHPDYGIHWEDGAVVDLEGRRYPLSAARGCVEPASLSGSFDLRWESSPNAGN